MKAKKTITELRKAGWDVTEIATQYSHYECCATGYRGKRTRSQSYKATRPGCHFRLEFFVELAESADEHDEHDDIQLLGPNEPSNALGCIRVKTVKRAMEMAVSYSSEIDAQKARRKSMDALFDGSDAHRLIG